MRGAAYFLPLIGVNERLSVLGWRSYQRYRCQKNGWEKPIVDTVSVSFNDGYEP